MEAQLCPLEDRRSATEVSFKLLVVHLTVITAYCHLLSLRGEPILVICRKAIIFFMCPGSIIIQYILAIIILTGSYIFARVCNQQTSTLLQLSIKRAPIILFGKIDRTPSHSAIYSWDSMIKVIGRVIVVLALAVQSIGSCIIFARRYQHNAATLGDWRVVELAISALLISPLTIAYLVWEPGLRLSPAETLNLSQSRRRTYLDAILLYLRDVPAPRARDSTEENVTEVERTLFRFWLNGPIIFGIYCTQSQNSRRNLISGLATLSFGGIVRALGLFDSAMPGCDKCLDYSRHKIPISLLQVSLISLSSLTALFLLSPGASKLLVRRTGIGTWRVLLRLSAYLPIGLLIWGVLTGLILALAVFLLIVTFLIPPFILFDFTEQISQLAGQLKMLATWPTDVECPLLWSDPKANVLWHLM